MGEVADMVLEGLLDEHTGEYIGDANLQHYGTKAPGFPVTYEPTHIPLIAGEAAPGGKIACPHCGKHVKPRGLGDHLIDIHGYHHAEKVQCPLCPKHTKVEGLWQHMRDKHEEAGD
ncbi:hypothetical protein [Halofilum ochraceum]|uniref:hypothetical protein n=1 Tax=Halofilum ochraceum TaxID=1611323 RepID=UPI0008DAAA69|nr:hypothetical protein [Halofilum ochraceum]